MSEKNECGKVIDVTSNLGGFIPKKRRKRYKKGEGEKARPRGGRVTSPFLIRA